MSKRTAGLKAKGARREVGGNARSKAQPGVGVRKGHTSTQENRAPGQNFYRDNNTVRRLQMYNSKPDRAKMRQEALAPVRIEPGRKWFNNTRVVSQSKLEQFREAMVAKNKDPRSILVKATKLPVSLFDHSKETHKKRASNLLSIAPYSETFSAGRRQKRPRLDFTQMDELADSIETAETQYAETKFSRDSALTSELVEVENKVPVEAVMLKGTSRRIWGELYKVVDSSDVLVHVLDVRDPLGTRCYYLENHIKNDKPFKHTVLLLNKCDLVPTWVTDRWLKILGKEYPTVAFRASVKHPLGKRALIGLLRQFADLMKNRKHVSVGFIGYPNVGKSSVINTLRGKKVCEAAPIPGETKVWQYVDLTSRVYLIDCPGIVAASAKEDGANDVNKVLKGVVRAEKLDTPEDYIGEIFARVGRDKIHKQYKVPEEAQSWTEPEELLETMAKMWGKLGKGGEPRISPVALRIILDLQRGKLPYFVPPPSSKGFDTNEAANETATAETADDAQDEDHGVEASDDVADEHVRDKGDDTEKQVPRP